MYRKVSDTYQPVSDIYLTRYLSNFGVLGFLKWIPNFKNWYGMKLDLVISNKILSFL
jgi:hypothetical protein